MLTWQGFYEEKNRDFNGYNGAGRKIVWQATGGTGLKKSERLSWYYVVVHKIKKERMRHLIIKYSILVIVTTLVARLITSVIMMRFPMLLTQIDLDGSTTTFPLGFIERSLEYAMNILIIILMGKDLKKHNIKSLPILIVTFFFSFIGVIFFLLIAIQNKLATKNQTI